MDESMFTDLNGQKIWVVGEEIIRLGILDVIYLKIEQLKIYKN